MSKYKNALSGERSHIQSLRIFLAIALIIIAGLGYALYKVPSKLTIHNPPDLRSGSTRAWWEIDPSNVYGFSFYIFQQLNRWPVNGEEDYKKNIYSLQAFLTPSCQIFLNKDYENRKLLGELKSRVRGVYEMPERGYHASRVKVNSANDWNVTLDLYTDEYYLDNAVKRVLVRYPLHIVRYDIDPERNPWGLALDCFTETPKRIELKSKEAEIQTQ